MTDPHANDYCVICGATPESDTNTTYHPIASIKDGMICDTHVNEERRSERGAYVK